MSLFEQIGPGLERTETDKQPNTATGRPKKKKELLMRGGMHSCMQSSEGNRAALGKLFRDNPQRAARPRPSNGQETNRSSPWGAEAAETTWRMVLRETVAPPVALDARSTSRLSTTPHGRKRVPCLRREVNGDERNATGQRRRR
jgi:hypothetical protein